MSETTFRPDAYRYDKGALVGLAQAANKAEQNGENPIKATLGVLYGDNGELFGAAKFTDMMQVLAKDPNVLKYSKPDGCNELATELQKHVLANTKDLPANIHTSTAITPGGTGGISSTLQALDFGHIILGDASWPGYGPILRQLPNKNFKTEKFNLLDNEGKFNFESFKNVFEKAAKESSAEAGQNMLFEGLKPKSSALTILLNDPAANPTNTALSENDINDIIGLLQKHPNTKVNLLIDIAYRDLTDGKDQDLVANLGKLFSKVNNPNLNVVILGSVSKMLPFYGMRVGHATLLSPNANAARDWKGYIGGGVRATSSNTNTFAQKLVLRVLKHGKALMQNYQNEAKALLASRRESFEKAFGDGVPGLQYIKPAAGGFFACVKTASNEVAQQLQSTLKEQHKVFIPVIDKYIRVPYCALKDTILADLANKIKDAFASIQARTSSLTSGN